MIFGSLQFCFWYEYEISLASAVMKMVKRCKLNISVDTEMLLVQFESTLQHFRYN